MPQNLSADSRQNFLVCPFCHSNDIYPYDFDWYCANCGQSHPTAAFKCRTEDCWESVFLKDRCDKHALERWETDGGRENDR